MAIAKRLTEIIASGFALAAAPDAQTWKTPRPAPDHPATSAPPPPRLPEQAKSNTAALQARTLTKRELVVFASGFALAAAATVGLWLFMESDSLPVLEKLKARVTSPQSSGQVSGQLSVCSMEPATLAASQKDGLFPLQAGAEGLIVADIASFMAIANQAAAAGRPRDAEAAFLMSCRAADKLMGAHSVESAEAKYQLGAHYERLALDGGVAAGSDRAELLRRAERLYRDSLQAATANYGKAHEKSRLAAQGLAAVRQTLAQGDKLQPLPAPVLAPEPETGSAVLRQAPAPALAPAPSGAATAPPVRPAPAANAEAPRRQDQSAQKKCPDAVSALGLCGPAN